MATSILQTEVIIIGAGPTGLSLACQFIRFGIDFIIIDIKDGVTPYSKALGVHARTLEIYEQLNIATEAVTQGTVASKVRMIYANKIRGEFDLSTIGTGMSDYPYMLVLEQSKNERLLYDYMLKNGKDVIWQTTLDDFTQTDSQVTAHIRHANGETQTIQAQYLVGCDGPKSAVRHGLGLAFEGSTIERLFYVADVQIDWQYSHDALQVCLTPNAVVAFFPMPGEKRYRVVGAFPEGFDKEEGETLYEEIEQRIKLESQIALEITQVNWFSTYKVHTRHVEKFAVGRCFLAGDAAHIHTPAGGQGMNTGIQDAYNLAWKLAYVLRGNAQSKVLDTYHEERLPNAQRLLKSTDRMFNIVATSSPVVNFIRTRIFPHLAKYIVRLHWIKKRFFPFISQIGINYRGLSLSQHATDAAFNVKAGDRMPYFLIDGRSVYHQLRAAKFHIIAFTYNPVTDTPINTSSIQEYATIADFQALPLTAEIMKLFGTNQPFTLLLRPDNYISFVVNGSIADDTVLNSLTMYFKQIIGYKTL